MATVIIKEKKKRFCAAKHDVYLANTYIGRLISGGSIEIPVEVGKQTIYFKNIRHRRAGTVFNIVVNQEDEIVELRTKYSHRKYVVEYADKETRGFCCPKCGSTDLVTVEVQSGFNSRRATIGCILLGPLGLLFGISKKEITTYWSCNGCQNKFKL